MAKALATEHVQSAKEAGTSIPDPKDVTVNGKAGLAYSDPLGWRSILWVVDDNAVMSVTGLRMDDQALMTFAEGIEFK